MHFSACTRPIGHNAGIQIPLQTKPHPCLRTIASRLVLTYMHESSRRIPKFLRRQTAWRSLSRSSRSRPHKQQRQRRQHPQMPSRSCRVFRLMPTRTSCVFRRMCPCRVSAQKVFARCCRHPCLHTHIHTYTHVHEHTYAYAPMFTHTHTHTHPYLHTHIHMY